MLHCNNDKKEEENTAGEKEREGGRERGGERERERERERVRGEKRERERERERAFFEINAVDQTFPDSNFICRLTVLALPFA